MAKSQPQSSTEIAPPNFPSTIPPVYPSADYSFTLQAIMEMQKTLGQLTQAVTTLTEESKTVKDKVDKISHKVFAAQVVIYVVGFLVTAFSGLAVFILNKIWDTIIPLSRVIK